MQVTINEQIRNFAEAIEVALANGVGPTLIECIIDRDDCSPELIS